MNEIIKKYLDSLNIKKLENLEDIKTLVKAHIRTYSFSSAKVLLKDEISLKLEDIYKSLVEDKRGAYCFEHNKLLYEALKESGFNVNFFLARVVNNTDAEVPQTHRFTLLNFEDKRYLIDVGIGFNTPSVLVDFEEETSSHNGFTYKIEKKDLDYELQKIKEDEVYVVTKFDLNPCVEADFELGHFYSHKHPCAVFVNNLVLSSIDEGVIKSLRNNTYLKLYENRSEEIDISFEDKFSKVLKEDFNLNFSDIEIKTLFENHVKE